MALKNIKISCGLTKTCIRLLSVNPQASSCKERQLHAQHNIIPMSTPETQNLSSIDPCMVKTCPWDLHSCTTAVKNTLTKQAEQRVKYEGMDGLRHSGLCGYRLLGEIISRKYSSNPRDKKCPPRKKICRDESCPGFRLENCPPRFHRPSCKRVYKVECEKVKAPYRSYSELCAQRLPDDPSECFQCPWKPCPVHYVRPKKGYHTVSFAHRRDLDENGLQKRGYHSSSLDHSHPRPNVMPPAGIIYQPSKVYKLKECDEERGYTGTCRKRGKKCPPVDYSINPKYQPDPCCSAKKTKRDSSVVRKVKVYVPDPPNYDNIGKL